MFVLVQVHQSLVKGTVVSFDGSLFNTAISSSSPMGVLNEDPVLNEDGNYYAPVIFAGTCWAIASQDIPNEGGKLKVLNGKVYVDNTADECGIISPNPRGSNPRLQNDLVMIHIR